MLDVTVIIVVLVLALAAIVTEALRKFIDIYVTSWMLRRQGVPDREIHKIALAQARRQRQNLVIQVLKLMLNAFKK